MLTDYRIDKWHTIFTEVLTKTLRSAFLSTSVSDFILCSIEAMSPNIQIESAERISILENLWKVFQVRNFRQETKISDNFFQLKIICQFVFVRMWHQYHKVKLHPN